MSLLHIIFFTYFFESDESAYYFSLSCKGKKNDNNLLVESCYMTPEKQNYRQYRLSLQM